MTVEPGTLEQRIEAVGQELPGGVPYVQCGSPGRAWLVLEGRLSLFLARRHPESGVFIRRHKLFDVRAGEFLFDLMETEFVGATCVPVFIPAPRTRCVAFDARALGADVSGAELQKLREALACYGALVADSGAKAAPLAPVRDFADVLAAARECWRQALAARITVLGEGEVFPPAPPPNEFEIQCLRRTVLKRAAARPDFKGRFLSDPRGAAARIMGRHLPDNFNLRVELAAVGETRAAFEGKEKIA